jgi:hypothetical protein
MALTKFAAGTRVRMKSRGSSVAYGSKGTVEEASLYPLVRWDAGGPFGNKHWRVDESALETIEPTSTYLNGHKDDIHFITPLETPFMSLLKKQERFVTAYKDGPDFALTGDNAFNTQRDADNHANELAANEADVTVVVLKVVSQHSSRIVVTSEIA